MLHIKTILVFSEHPGRQKRDIGGLSNTPISVWPTSCSKTSNARWTDQLSWSRKVESTTLHHSGSAVEISSRCPSRPETTVTSSNYSLGQIRLSALMRAPPRGGASSGLFKRTHGPFESKHNFHKPSRNRFTSLVEVVIAG